MKLTPSLLLGIFLLLPFSANSQNRKANLSVNINDTHQHVSGFGGFSPSPQWSYWLGDADIDKMYGKADNQLGYTIMRIFIGSSEWSWGSAVSNAKRAKKYGAYVFGSPWSPPASWKDNNDESNGGHLLESHYGDWANHLNKFIQKMKDNGVKLDGVSLQNEADYTTSYASCRWTSEEFVTFLKKYGSKINADIICPEDVHLTTSYIDPILKDPDACKEVDIIGTHFYGWNGGSYPLAAEKGKEVWMTEYLINERQQNNNQNINWVDDGFLFAKSVNDAMLADFSAWVHYSLKRYYGCLGDGQYGTVDGKITKRGYILSHFAKYVSGTTRITHSFSGSSSGMYGSAYRSVTGDSIVVMVMNPTSSDTDMTFKLPYDVNSGHSIITTETLDMKKTLLSYESKTKTPVETVPAYSVCTFIFKKTTEGIISLSADGQGSVSGGGKFRYGNEITVSASAASGMNFIGWYQNDILVSSDSVYSFTVDNDRNLKAVFSSDLKYPVMVCQDSHATVYGSGVYEPGNQVTVSIEPETGYHFVCWLAGSDTIRQREFTVPAVAPVTYFPIVEINRYDVTALQQIHGTVIGTGTFDHGTKDTLIAESDYGYCVEGWIIDNDTIACEDSTYVLEIVEPHSVGAVFNNRRCPVKVWTSGGGTVSKKRAYVLGEPRYLDTLTVVAKVTKDHYVFAGWYEGLKLVSTDAEYTFVVTGERTLEGVFEIETFNIGLECGEGGTATLQSNPVRYRSSLVLNIEPEPGYVLESLFMNGTDCTQEVSAGVFRKKVTEPVSIVVTFAIDTGVEEKSVTLTSVKCYDLNGKECLKPENGLYIEVQTWSDGSRTVRKVKK